MPDPLERAADLSAGISRSLGPLRDVVTSLASAGRGEVPSGNDRRRLVRRVRAAGTAAMPALFRALHSVRDAEADWAVWLLLRLDPDRVAQRAAQLIEDPRAPDAVRTRALGLLADLDLPIEPTVVVPERLLALSINDLLDSLSEERDVRMAVELVARQIPDGQIPGFAAAVARHGGVGAVALLDAMMRSRRLPKPTRFAVGLVLEGLVIDVLDEDPGSSMRRTDRRAPESPPAERVGRRPVVRPARGSRSAARRGAGAPGARGGAVAPALSTHAAADPALEQTRMQLEEALARTPDEPETLSQLATCLLRLGEFAEAVAHFERAALLAPDRAIHHWNLGGAARACGRMSRSYSALVRYLEIADDAEGWRARRREARRFMRSYEKLIRTSYPGTAALDLQRGEELFLRAYDDMTSGRYEEASDGFRGVIALLPAHYPSWGNLGAALVALGDGEGATRCLLRALELRPDYQIARDNLALLD